MTTIDITPVQARELMQQTPAPTIIDVRTPEEFRTGRIPGAINVPLDTIERALKAGVIPEESLKAKDRLFLLYCRSGRRSGIAARLLAEQGWTQVRNFGGILDWPYETVRD